MKTLGLEAWVSFWHALCVGDDYDDDDDIDNDEDNDVVVFGGDGDDDNNDDLACSNRSITLYRPLSLWNFSD